MSRAEAFEAFFNGSDVFKGLGVSCLEKTYLWSIPRADLEWLSVQEGCGYQANVQLKNILRQAWKNSLNDQPGRFEIARWVIKDWGGIGGNKTETIMRFVVEATKNIPETPVEGIASFSKVLAASNPQKYAIYDARVAVSLNAIQYLARVGQDGMAFPYLPGRNKITGDTSSKQKRGFSTVPAFSREALCLNLGWRKVPRKEAYAEYLKVLRSSNSGAIYELEMALFAQAEILACMAMERTVV